MTPVSAGPAKAGASIGPAKAGHCEGDDGNQARDAAFTAAWSAFATDDERASAPHALEARILEAAREVCRHQHALSLISLRQRVVVALATAAALALVAGGLISRSTTADTPTPTVQVLSDTGVEEVPNGTFPAATRRGDALVTLAVDPVKDTEQLALVHIRVPQNALMAMGIATNEPGASGLVDVEVLVGGDGLPRDIRRMRTVLTDDTHDSR
jgi:hypothetical protein